MKLTKKLTVYLLTLGFLSALGVWFCMDSIFKNLHEHLLNYSIFSIFRGNREFYINLLVGICTSSLFAAIGFLVSYFETKKKRQEQLIAFYLKIKDECFENILYKKNYYDNKHGEVVSIRNYLNEYKNIVLDYSPFFLKIKVRIKKHIRKKAKSNHTNSTWNSTKYKEENLFALICSLFGDLFRYFSYIDLMQSFIIEIDRVISISRDNKKRLEDEYSQFNNEGNHFNAKRKKIEIDTINRTICTYEEFYAILKNRLTSRFPYNTKEYQLFLDKEDLVSKFYSIDQNIPEFSFCYFGELLSIDNYIVKDNEILYQSNDSEINYNSNFNKH